jgi:aspartyl-tRNA(Asn)/glutamyl-tRNA(Gln) amidotransferase subunit A
MSTPLHYLTITEAQRLIRAKELSPLELTQALLDRITQIDSKLNAYLTVTIESALAQARSATEAIAHGDDLGALHGIPIGLKDLFDLKGVRTTAGSILLKDNVVYEDAFVTKRLRNAGAIFLGKLNMHEWAYGVTTINPHFGTTHNPWNVDHIVGGSSGGSGAALAAGLCIGALGSDTGGSIRIPASLCGIVGLKPTYGRVSVRGVIPLSWSLDHVGPMARSVEDVALLFSVITGYDEDDPYSMRNAELGMRDEDLMLRTPHSQFRIGIPDESFLADLHPETRAAIEIATTVMKDLGFALRQIDLSGADEASAASLKILQAEAAAYHRDRMLNQADQIGTDVLTRLKTGDNVSGIDYANARRLQVKWIHQMRQLFESIEAIVLPATPMPAMRIDEADPIKLSRGNLTRFTRMFNFSGNPAIVLPCGFTSDGLPIGLQIVGGHRQEEKVLQLAYAYEQATEWHKRFSILD